MPTVVFDYDGTIQETMKIYAPAVRRAAEWIRGLGYELEDPSDERISGWLGIRNVEMWADFAPFLDEKKQLEGSHLIGREMRRLVLEGTDPWYDGIRGSLDELRRRGFTMFVLSSCEKSYADFNMAEFGMARWFEDFVDCESLGGTSKAEILSGIAAGQIEAGVRDASGQYIVVGDRSGELAAAKKTGAPFVGCTYGYGRPGEIEGADIFADDAAGVAAAVEKAAEICK
jgi:phosphoglycolate phosphatase